MRLAVASLLLLLSIAPRAHACVSDSECADATVCNGVEVCIAGACQPGVPLACADANPCTTDACNPSTGCLHVALANGTSCSDGDVCNGAETCQSGICTPGTPPNCVDASPCTVDSCDSQAGHCVYTPVSNGTPCADANVCNGTETCQSGLCAPGTALDCSDGDDCTVDSCTPLSGCAHTVATDGTVCGDSNPCNGTETCIGGACAAGVPIPEGGACPDGDVCNGAETCVGGTCSPGAALDCDDQNVCTDDACHAVFGCLHDIAVCEDGVADTVDQCVPGTGCEFHALVPGTLVLMRANASSPDRTKLRLVTGAGGAIVGPPPNAAASDPVIAGGSLRLVTPLFDQTYFLPADHWTYIGPPGENHGYRYRDKFHLAGPIVSAVLRQTGLAVVTGKGRELALSLQSDPAPVRAVLQLGLTKYCMSFGGETRFVPENQFFKARLSPAPSACP